MRFWKALNSQIDHSKFRVTAVTTEKESTVIRDFIKDYSIEDWDVLEIPPEEALEAKFGLTPITTVVGQRGRVEKAWVGFWRDDQIRSIDEYFGINLIGL